MMTKTKQQGRRASKAGMPSAQPQSIGAAKREAKPRKPAQAANKLDTIVTLLRRPHGATLPMLMGQTGWQAHSIRGAIAGTIKKRLGLAVESKRVGGERVYRIVK